MKTRTLAEIGEYYNTSHLLRPIQTRLVEEYSRLMKKDGVTFPPIQLGEYPAPGGEVGKLIIDGVHIYRALVLGKMAKHPIELVQYESLSDALAAQLQKNLTHGKRVSLAQRDSRIRELSEVYNWTIRKIADAVALHFSSVSRIVNKKQTKAERGETGATRGRVVPHALPPTQFFKAVQNVHLTLSKGQSRAQVVAALHDPKQAERLKGMVNTLREVEAEVREVLGILDSATGVGANRKHAA